MREPIFTETLQIAIVVRDLEATMRTYVEEYGIGPWEIYDFCTDDVAPLEGGEYKGATFAYLSTDEDLKVITEIFDWPEGLVQKPNAVYPAA
jgi:hypothetical protein